MGLCQSVEQRELFARNQEINRQMRKERAELHKTVKLLLLGTGESGKSTVLKQMRILHSKGFSEEEIQKQREIVYGNVVQSMAAIVHAMATLDIRYDDTEREVDARVVQDAVKAGNEFEPLTAELHAAIKTLWSDTGVQKAFGRRNEYQLNDSAKYFLDALDRIYENDFTPTLQDILCARVATNGIVEVKFALKNMDFRVFDVGGQRSERKKWIHCFDDVNSVLFITAISEFDQTLYEDDSTNRMTESLQLFDSIANCAWFYATSIILFLNKTDLFAEKIARAVSIRKAFPEYRGPDTYDDSAKYIENQFTGLNQNSTRAIFRHQTCATDTNQVQLVLDNVVETIISQNLHDLGLSA